MIDRLGLGDEPRPGAPLEALLAVWRNEVDDRLP
jgi:hypothetical protein